MDMSGINIQLEDAKAETQEMVVSTDHAEEGAAAPERVPEIRNPVDRPIYALSVKLIDTYKHINKVRTYICLDYSLFVSSIL